MTNRKLKCFEIKVVMIMMQLKYASKWYTRALNNALFIIYDSTVLPPNSRFLGPGFFHEFEIREFKIHDYRIIKKNREFGGVYLIIP